MSSAWFVVEESTHSGRDPGIGPYKIKGPYRRGTSIYNAMLAFVRAGTAKGPYRTRAAAQAEWSKLGGKGTHATTPSVTQQGTSGAAINSAVENVVPGLAGISAFLEHLSDGAMWRSIGWIALGVVLLMLGLMLWLRKPAAELAGAALKGGL